MKTTKLDYNNSWLWIIGLLIISFVAFWPTYYAILSESDTYVHFHAVTSLFWFALLILQPLLIKKRRLKTHRLLGKISYPVAGLVIVSIVLLAHDRISTSPEEIYDFRTYILYLQISLALVFAITYGLAIWYRKTKSIHARLMVATSFTFIDPVLARFIGIILPDLEINTQWLTFGIINLLLITLSIIDRNNRKAKWVFPGLLLLYLITELPIYFSLTGMEWWQTFAAWFAYL
jgi:hypothetical protein